VRYRLMASYRGSPFEAGIGPTDGDIVLFAACPPPEDLGFEPATGHWRKQLRIQEVQAVWESRPVGTFRGERCMVLDDLGDRLHIGYLGHDGYKAEQLGYWQVDRGVFELVAPRTEVSDILEERTEYPRVPVSKGQPAPAVTPPAAGYPRSGATLTGPHPTLTGPQPTLTGPQPTLTGPQPTLTGPQPTLTGPHPTLTGPHPTLTGPQPTLSGSHPVPSVYPAAEPARYLPPADQDFHPGRPDGLPGAYPPATSYSAADPSVTASQPVSAVYPLAPDEASGVALPMTAEAPLPLEAEAMRAASASRRPRQPAQRRGGAGPATAIQVPVPQAAPPASALVTPRPSVRQPGQVSQQAAPTPTAPAVRQASSAVPQAAPAVRQASSGVPQAAPAVPQAPPAVPQAPRAGAQQAGPVLAAPAPITPGPGGPQQVPSLRVVPDLAPLQPGPAQADAPARQRRAARRRLATERLFADLASQAGIPADSYAVGEEVEGALCLVQTESGFEVFHSAGGARHELQVFATEESACFYLFGVLTAEAVRNGSLTRLPVSRA
jgi:hypothetical protein